MSTNIPQAVRHLITEYKRFLRTSYRSLDDSLRQQFDTHLDSAEVIVKGPYVTLARDLAPGATLCELAARGEAEPGLLDLRWSFGDEANIECDIQWSVDADICSGDRGVKGSI